MNANELLENITQLLDLYIQTGNRKVLTNLRRAVTTATQNNRLYSFRLEELFAERQVSLAIL